MGELRSTKDVEIEELRIESAMGLVKGFDKAKKQVKFFHPTLSFSELDPLIEIVDGKLVEVASPEDDDAEMTDATDVV